MHWCIMGKELWESLVYPVKMIIFCHCTMQNQELKNVNVLVTHDRTLLLHFEVKDVLKSTGVL